MCRDRCQHSPTLHRKISVCFIMKFSFALEGGGAYLLNSELEISSFKVKLLEISENLKSDVVSQGVLME